MSVSLDGYVTGPNDSSEHPFGDGAESLHAWLGPSASDADRTLLESAMSRVGAVVMGRRFFEKNEGDGGWADAGPLGETPCVVLTHHLPIRPYPPVFTFVYDGVASAIRDAHEIAGAKDVRLFGASIMQQALPLGLVDELHLHVMPLLVDVGTALFGNLETAIRLERTRAQTTPAATHLEYCVLR